MHPPRRPRGADLQLLEIGDPADLPHEVIGDQNGRPILRYSTDSPLRDTSGDLEAMALYAGQGVDAITSVIPAAERLRHILAEAEAILKRLCNIGKTT